jgi:hypothetical protein
MKTKGKEERKNYPHIVQMGILVYILVPTYLTSKLIPLG